MEITFNVSSYAGGYHVSCNAATNGYIDATIVNGVPPYTYQWSNGATTQNLSNIGAGTYTLTVYDNAGHQKSKTKTLLQPGVLQATLTSSQYPGPYNVSKFGGSDGSVTANVTGGSPPYTYSWNTGATIASITGITVGTYSVTVTDANQCTVQQSTTLTQPAALQVSSISSSMHNGYNVSCNNGSDGNTTVVVTGGVPPYRFLWSNGSFNQNQSNLSVGTYNVSVRDTNNTSTNAQITLTQPTAISNTVTPSVYPNGFNVSCYQCYNGNINSSTSGGVTPYSYSWSTGQTTANISILGGGTYQLTITDGNNCTKLTSLTLTEPASDDWTLTGNSGINSSSRFIGTSDTSSVSFRTNNTEAMRITNSGNVGIGTANPQAKLDITGGVKVSTLSYSGGNSNEIRLIGTTPIGEIKGLNIIGHAPDFPLSTCINPFMGWFNSTCSGADPNKLFKIPMEGNLGIGTDNPQAKVEIISDGNSSNSSALLITNSSSTSLLKILDDGKIGINESSPEEKLTVNGNLHVKGTILGKQSTGALFINGNTTSKNGGTVELYGSGSGSPSEVRLIGKSIGFYDYHDIDQWDLNMVIKDNGDIGIGKSNPSAKLDIVTNYSDQSHLAIQVTNSSGSNLLSVRSDGQIGIGTVYNDPLNDLPTSSGCSDCKLSVNGRIYSEGMTIRLSDIWPDYVFDNNYKLMGLKEVEDYLKDKKHLPGLPNAEQVIQHGIEIEELNIALLKKVEELTLYVIELQKQVDALSK